MEPSPWGRGGCVPPTTRAPWSGSATTSPPAPRAACPAFDLLETLLFEADGGYYLLDRHLRRLADSARYFGFAFDEGRVVDCLRAAVAGAEAARRVCLTLSRNGAVEAQS